MAHALRLAARGNGACWPNPSVGCVIVRDGAILGRGTTAAGGRPHAEALALAQAGAAARGATAYVTLEPCAHQGRGPPCAGALAAAGVARVVTAIGDPDPRTAGRGHAILRAAGIAVTEGVLAPEAAQVTAGFLKRVTRGLPFVTLKLAATLDGRIATASGESRWITGEAARRHVHALRLSHDAVLVGAGTARADDPELTVRGFGPVRQPLRIVFDSRLSLPPDSRLGRSARAVPLWLVHGEEAPAAARAAWAATGAGLVPCPAGPDGRIAPRAAMAELAARGLTRILCESGGTLAASLVRADLVDDLAHYTAGRLIGAEGRAVIGALGIGELAGAPRLALRALRRLDGDVFALWSLAAP